MIAIAGRKLDGLSGGVARRRQFFTHLDTLRLEARDEIREMFDGVSQKRITAVEIPGCSRSSISRAANGCTSNALYRLSLTFKLARLLGIEKAKVQRALDYLQSRLDEEYAESPEKPLAEVLDDDAETDVKDDLLRQRARAGDMESARALIRVKVAQVSRARVTIQALRVATGR